MRFKLDRANLIVGSKFTVFALFYFVCEGNFPSTSPRGAYIWRGDLTEGFLRYRFGGLYLEGLIHGGTYFRNFTVYCYVYVVTSLRVNSAKKLKRKLNLNRNQLRYLKHTFWLKKKPKGSPLRLLDTGSVENPSSSSLQRNL